MEQAKIERINVLAKKAKTEGLTSEEILEQKQLRQEYIEAWRISMRAHLDNTLVLNEDGTTEKLKKKGGDKT